MISFCIRFYKESNKRECVLLVTDFGIDTFLNLICAIQMMPFKILILKFLFIESLVVVH